MHTINIGESKAVQLSICLDFSIVRISHCETEDKRSWLQIKASTESNNITLCCCFFFLRRFGKSILKAQLFSLIDIARTIKFRYLIGSIASSEGMIAPLRGNRPSGTLYFLHLQTNCLPSFTVKTNQYICNRFALYPTAWRIAC